MNVRSVVTEKPARAMPRGFCRPLTVGSGSTSRFMVIFPVRRVATGAPTAVPPTPTVPIQGASGLTLLGAAVGRTPGSTVGQPITVALHLSRPDSASKSTTSCERHP